MTPLDPRETALVRAVNGDRALMVCGVVYVPRRRLRWMFALWLATLAALAVVAGRQWEYVTR